MLLRFSVLFVNKVLKAPRAPAKGIALCTPFEF